MKRGRWTDREAGRQASRHDRPTNRQVGRKSIDLNQGSDQIGEMEKGGQYEKCKY